MSASEAVDVAQAAEELGYSTLWLPETTGGDPLIHIAHLASQTTGLRFATGIANVSRRNPQAMKSASMTLAELTGGRLVLGLGVGPAGTVAGMRSYVKQLTEAPYNAPSPRGMPPLLLAAIGPSMTRLAAEMAHGAHTYAMDPLHTSKARAVLGADAWLCVEQKIILSADLAQARQAARSQLAMLHQLHQYVRRWLSLGYSHDDITGMSDRFLDGLVALGGVEQARTRIEDHYRAGATHVCIQPLDPSDGRTFDMGALEALAPRPRSSPAKAADAGRPADRASVSGDADTVYLVSQMTIHDIEMFSKYANPQDFSNLVRNGGRIVAVDESPEVWEGTWVATRTVIIQFPSRQQARNWYFSPEYQQVAALRRAAADSNVAVLGLKPPGRS
jgi:probable F420-dependent oxidoreductase